MDTVEKVLFYHVVLGAPILSGAAVAANGADLTTAEEQPSMWSSMAPL